MFIKVYRVNIGCSQDRYFSTRKLASLFAEGKGEYHSNANVYEEYYTVINHSKYILKNTKPIVIDEDDICCKKLTALNKLDDEEKKLLGLEKYIG